MRILHTSDWHVGRRFNDVDVLDHLGVVLDAMVDAVRTEQIDVVVVAGDIFDRASPPPEAFNFLDQVLVKIRKAGAQVVLISGNHDGASRLSFMSAAAASFGIHVRTRADQIGDAIVIDDAHGPVHFYGIPYLDPTLDRAQFDAELPRSHEAILDAAMDRVRADLAGRGARPRSVVLSHCFAVKGKRDGALPRSAETAAQVTDSMRSIAVGGVEVAPTDVFEGASYVALGHLHTKQALDDRIRYSGAPLAYSFGDERVARGFWVVDLGAEGDVHAEWRTLPIPRKVSTITGELDALISDPAYDGVEDDWISAILTDQARPTDAMRKLRNRFAHCVHLEHRPLVIADGGELSYQDRVRGKSDEDLAVEFVAHVRNGVAASLAERALIAEAFEDLRAAEVAE
ncbi:exonuclease SbcCD subunit D [Antricoccus suffuscus]|nr:exonuclease SbcCD subunit D [Antricoccus suffuscus]